MLRDLAEQMSFLMKSILSVLFCVTLLFSVEPALAQATPQLPPNRSELSLPIDFVAAYDLAVGKISAGDYEAAYKDLGKMAADASFPDAPAEIRYGTLATLGLLEGELGSADKAVELFLRGGDAARELRDAWYWEALARLAGMARDDGTLISAATALATKYPDVLKSWDTARFFGVLNVARSSSDEAGRRQLYEALWAIGYEPKTGGYPMDIYWLELMASYAASEDWDKAQAVAKSIYTAAGLATLAYDKRFFRFAPSDVSAAIEAAEQNAIAAARAAAAENPSSLETILVLTESLKTAGRFEDGLAVVDEALATIEAANADEPFKDGVQFLPWLHGHRSIFLKNLGRFDEALVAQTQAYDAAVAGGADTVSQGLNLAQTYLNLGRPADALEIVGKVDEASASEYGRLAGGAISVCALEWQGKHADAVKLVETLVSDTEDEVGPVSAALLCVDDLDQLAQLTIDQLVNPFTRARALRDVQQYRQGKLTEVEKALDERNSRLLARKDVSDAIASVGKVLDLPIYD